MRTSLFGLLPTEHNISALVGYAILNVERVLSIKYQTMKALYLQLGQSAEQIPVRYLYSYFCRTQTYRIVGCHALYLDSNEPPQSPKLSTRRFSSPPKATTPSRWSPSVQGSPRIGSGSDENEFRSPKSSQMSPGPLTQKADGIND